MSELKSTEYFKVILEKNNGEIEEKLYRKEKEKFNDGYAIVKAYSTDRKYANQLWLGVINSEYETIVPFRLWKNIEILGDQLLLQESKKESYTSVLKKYTYHMYLNQNGASYINTIGAYRKINERIVITENEQGLVYLYDLYTARRISSLFTEISPFEEIDGEWISFAKRKFPVDDIYRIPMEMKCYIDINGDPWSLTYNPFHNNFMYLTKEEFDFYYEKELSDFLEEQSFEKRDPIKIKNKLKNYAREKKNS